MRKDLTAVLKLGGKSFNPQYLYALNQDMLWVADPEAGSWGWVSDCGSTGTPCPLWGQVRAEDLVPELGFFLGKGNIQSLQAAVVGAAHPLRLVHPVWVVPHCDGYQIRCPLDNTVGAELDGDPCWVKVFPPPPGPD